MFDKKTVLILGAGSEQLPAYKICKNNLATIIGVDKNKNAPGLKLANYKIITSIRNDKKLISKIKKLKIKISAVVTVANDIPEIYYNICKELKVKNISKKSSILAANKLKLYKELVKNNVTVPKFFSIKKIDEGKKIIKKNNLKFVLKPTDGRGSRGVNYISSLKNFKYSFENSLENTKNDKLILQQYVKGTQISSESLVFKNKIFTILSYRNYKDTKKLYPAIIENGGDIPLKINKKLKKKIDILILKISKILNIKDSPLKCDLILSKGKIFVLEATPRFGGGYVASHSSEVLYGVNFLKLHIKILLNMKIDKINFIYKKKFLSIRFIFNNKIQNLNKKKTKLMNWDRYKKNIVLKVPPEIKDTKIRNIKSHADRNGCVLVQSDSRKKAIHIAEKITNFYNL